MTGKCEIDFLADLKGEVGLKEDVLKRIEKMVEKLRARDPVTPDGILWGDAAKRVELEMKGEAANYELQILHTYRAQRSLARRVYLLTEEGRTPHQAYIEVINGTGTAAESAANIAVARLDADIQKAGLKEQFALLHGKDEKFTLDFMRELGQLNKKINPNVGVSKNADALAVARIFHKHIQASRFELRKMGLKTANLEGRILRQLWDRERLVLSAPTADDFVKLVRDRVDIIGDEVVSDMPPWRLDQLLKDFYDEVLGNSTKPPALGPRDLVIERNTFAVQQAKSREIHFKGPEDELFIMKNFGGGDVQALMLETVRDLGKQVFLTSELGVNYRWTSEALIADAVALGGDSQSIRRGAGLTGVAGLLAPENLLDAIDGYHDTGATNPRLAQWVDTVHNWARAVYLPAASLNTGSDLPTLNAASRRYGVDASRSITGVVSQMFKGLDLPPDLLREAAGIIEAESVQQLGTIHRYVTLPGISNKLFNSSVWLTEKTFKWNGLNRATRMQKSVAYRRVSGMFADFIEEGKTWDDLSAAQRRLLIRGGMSDKDFSKLSTFKDTAIYKDGAYKFINIDVLPPELARKVNGVLTRFVSTEAVISPDVATRTILNFATRRGTLANAVARQATFLLSYPIAWMRQGISVEAEAAGGYLSRSVMRYAAMLTVYGVIVQMARDVSQGRTRDYDDPEVAFQVLREGMLRGGALSLPGELLYKWSGADAGAHAAVFGEDARYTTSSSRPFDLAEDIFIGGGVELLMKLADGTKDGVLSLAQGDVDKFIETVLSTTRSTVPTFAPGVKDVLDGLFFEELYDMVGSDKLQRAERRWHARTNGDYLLTGYEP